MGAKCSSVEKWGEAGEDGSQAMAGRSESRLSCCCTVESDSIAPRQQLPTEPRLSKSALKSRNSGKKPNMDSVASECSTRPSWSSCAVTSFRPMRINSNRVESNFKKVRRVAFEAVGQLNHFCVFARTSFEKKKFSAAFVALAGDENAREMSLEKFKDGLRRHNFTGRCDRVFYALCEDPRRLYKDDQGLVIRRDRFVQRLSALKEPFCMVVQQLMASRSFGIEFSEFASTPLEEEETQPDGGHPLKQDAGDTPMISADIKSTVARKARDSNPSSGLRHSSSLDAIAEDEEGASTPSTTASDAGLWENASPSGEADVDPQQENSIDSEPSSPGSAKIVKRIKNGSQPKKRCSSLDKGAKS